MQTSGEHVTGSESRPDEGVEAGASLARSPGTGCCDQSGGSDGGSGSWAHEVRQVKGSVHIGP